MSSRAQSASKQDSASASLERPSPFPLVALIGLATALRLVELGNRSFWLDEAASSMLARSNWHTFVTALLQRQTNMVLYYVLLRIWIQIGDSETWVRLLSVILGVASIAIVYQLVRVVFGTGTARVAAFLLSFSVFHIQYSQEARGYALVVLLTLLSCYCLDRLLRSATRSAQAAYIVASILMVYGHVFGVWILLAQWVCALLLPLKINLKKMVGIAAVVIAACISPLVFSLLFASDRSQLSWMQGNSASGLYLFFVDLSGDAGVTLLVLYVLLLLISLRSYLRTTQPPGRRIAYVFLWVWLLLPTFLVGGISLYRPMFQARYLLICLPPFLILAADGLTLLRSKLVFVVALITVAGMSLAGVNSYYQARVDLNHTDNWRDATSYCLAQAQAGDAVLFNYSAEEIPFREYKDRLGAGYAGISLVPEKTDLELLTTAGTWTTPALASSTASQHRRVWVMTALQPNAHTIEIEAALSSQLRQELRRTFGFVTLQLFVPADREAHAGKTP